MILSMNVFSHRNGKPNVEEFLLMKEAGFRDLTMEFQDAKLLLRDDFEDIYKELKQELDALGMTVSQTHLQCYSFALGSSVTKPEIDLAIERSVIATALVGASWGVLHPRTRYDAMSDRKLSIEDNIKLVAKLLPVAEKWNVGIAVENIPTWRDAPKNIHFGSYFEELIAVVDAFGGHPNLGICWDTGHAHLNPHCENQYEAIRQIGKRLKATHIASNEGRYDDHLMPPAFGSVDCVALAAVLKEIGYDGTICCELHGSELPETALSYHKLSHACGQYIIDLIQK